MVSWLVQVTVNIVVDVTELIFDVIFGLTSWWLGTTNTLTSVTVAVNFSTHVLAMVVFIWTIVHLSHHLDLLVLARYHLLCLHWHWHLQLSFMRESGWVGCTLLIGLMFELSLLIYRLIYNLMMQTVVLRAWPEPLGSKTIAHLNTYAIVSVLVDCVGLRLQTHTGIHLTYILDEKLGVLLDGC